MFRTPAQLGYAYENLRLSVMGETTAGWFLPIDNARGTVLFSHGNGGNIAGWLDAVTIYRDLRLNVLLYDYGGYGDSTGSPSEQRCYADIRAMWDWLTITKQIPAAKIVLIGRSLGGGVTSQLAAEVTPAAISMECTFLSAVKLGKQTMPYLPVTLLLRHRFETEKRINRFTAPVMVCHSPTDEIVPYAQGKALFDLIATPKRFVELQGGHNEALFISEKAYADAFREFILPLLDAGA